MVALPIKETILNRVKLTAFLNLQFRPFLDDISEVNVMKTINDFRAKSTVIATLQNEGKVKLVGAMYDVSTGKVRFLYRF